MESKDEQIRLLEEQKIHLNSEIEEMKSKLRGLSIELTQRQQIISNQESKLKQIPTLEDEVQQLE